MKKTILTILLAVASFGLFAQSIQYKQTSITITNDGGFSTLQNAIRYSIVSNLSDANTLEVLFPDIKFELVNGKLQYVSSVQVPTMWDVIEQFTIQQDDLGKTVKSAIILWSTKLIYQLNLLELKNINDWNINE